MKFEKNPKYNTFALLALIVVAFAGLLISIAVHIDAVGALLGKLISVFMPLFCAIIIILVLLPGVDFFKFRFLKLLKKHKNHEKKAEKLAILSVYLILLLVVVLAVVIIIPQFSLLYNFILGSTDYLGAVDKFSEQLAEQSQFLGERFAELIERLEKTLFDSVKALPTFATSIASALGRIVGGISNWILGLIISIYALLRRARIKALIRKANAALFNANASTRVADVCREFYNHTVWFFSGRAYNMLALAIAFYIVLLLMGIKFHAVICLLVAISSLVPVFGMLIGGSVSTLIILITDTGMTIWFMLIFTVIMILNHIFLRPRLTSEKVRLGLGTTMICVLIGYFLLNVTGALFAVPTYITVRNMFSAWKSKRLSEKAE